MQKKLEFKEISNLGVQTESEFVRKLCRIHNSGTMAGLVLFSNGGRVVSGEKEGALLMNIMYNIPPLHALH